MAKEFAVFWHDSGSTGAWVIFLGLQCMVQTAEEGPIYVKQIYYKAFLTAFIHHLIRGT